MVNMDCCVGCENQTRDVENRGDERSLNKTSVTPVQSYAISLIICYVSFIIINFVCFLLYSFPVLHVIE
jgi:hypothetical protein